MSRPRLEGTSQLKFRVPAAIRDGLEDAAAANGRSLNAEITERLAQSLRPKRYWDTMDNPRVNAIIDLVAQVIYSAGHSAGSMATLSSEGSSSWFKHPRAYQQVAKAAAFALENMRPPVPSVMSTDDQTNSPAILDQIGETVARGILDEVTNPKASVLKERKERGYRIAHELGEEIVANIRINLKGKS